MGLSLVGAVRSCLVCNPNVMFKSRTPDFRPLYSILFGPPEARTHTAWRRSRRRSVMSVVLPVCCRHYSSGPKVVTTAEAQRMRPNPTSRRTLPDFASGETINSTSDRVRDGDSAQGLASLFHVTRRAHRYRTLPLLRQRSMDNRTRCGKRKTCIVPFGRRVRYRTMPGLSNATDVL